MPAAHRHTWNERITYIYLWAVSAQRERPLEAGERVVKILEETGEEIDSWLPLLAECAYLDRNNKVRVWDAVHEAACLQLVLHETEPGERIGDCAIRSVHEAKGKAWCDFHPPRDTGEYARHPSRAFYYERTEESGWVYGAELYALHLGVKEDAYGNQVVS